MARNVANRYMSRERGTFYLILIGVIILLISYVTAVFAKQAIAGIVLLLIGVLVCVVGLSKYSLSLLKRKARK